MSLGPKARWQWKLGQLRLEVGLTGQKKMGRERKTAFVYAADAEAFGDQPMADALRTRATNHEKCERLAFGGIMSRPDFQSVQNELHELDPLVETWPPHSQKLTTKRHLKEMCSIPNAAVQNWGVFEHRLALWPLPGDGKGPHKWSVDDPTIRHMDLEPQQKLEFFVEVLTEFVIGPLISNGQSGEAGLIVMLERLAEAVDVANGRADSDEWDDLFENVMARIRGVACFVRREHGWLRSTKADAVNVRTEADAGESSIYGKLTANPHYRDLVAEYWASVEVSDTAAPMYRKQVRLLDAVGGKVELSACGPVFAGALDIYEKYHAQTRKTHADALHQSILAKAQVLAAQITLSPESEWISSQSKEWLALLDRISRCGDFSSTSFAVEALNGLAPKSETAAAIERFDAMIAEVKPHLTNVDWLSVDISKLGSPETELKHDIASSPPSIALLDELIQLFRTLLESDAEVDAIVLLPSHSKKLTQTKQLCVSIPLASPERRQGTDGTLHSGRATERAHTRSLFLCVGAFGCLYAA